MLYDAPFDHNILKTFWEIIKGKLRRGSPQEFPIRHVCFAGFTGAGKTSLWKLLAGKKLPETHETTMGLSKISPFNISYDDKTVTIKDCFDIGGSHDDVVSCLEECIKHDGTLVFFLIDIEHYEQHREEVRSQCVKVKGGVDSRKLKMIIVFMNWTKEPLGPQSESFETIYEDIYGVRGVDRTVEYRIVNVRSKDCTNEIKRDIVSYEGHC